MLRVVQKLNNWPRNAAEEQEDFGGGWWEFLRGEWAARGKMRVCHLWCNAEGNRIDTLLNKSSGRLLNLRATTVDRIRWVTLEVSLFCSTKPCKWLSGWNVCRRRNMPLWCCCFLFLCTKCSCLSFLHSSQRASSLFLFPLLEGERGGRRERERETLLRRSTKKNKQLQYVYSGKPEGRRGPATISLIYICH